MHPRPSMQIAVVAFLLLAHTAAIAAMGDDGHELQGQVTAVHDGDTFELRTGARTRIRIRLADIDAPELAQANGQASRSNLEKLVGGQFVTVANLEPDRYGRTVGKVLSAGLDVNLAQIQAGYAWAYIKFDPPMSYIVAENDARRTKRGLWADPYPQAPWEWRHRSKGKARH